MSSKTHLLVCNIEYPPIGGGAGPVGAQLIKQLINRYSYIVDVVTMGYGDLPPTEKINSRLTIHRIPSFRSNPHASHPWQHLVFIHRAQSLINGLHQKHPFNICHAHFLVPTGILAMQLQKKLNLPYIITAHGTDVPGHNPNRLTLLHRFTKPTIINVINHAAEVVFPSQYLKQTLTNSLNPTNPDNFQIIPNGIDTNYYTPMRKHNYIVSTGRLIPGKGFQTLIQAVSHQDVGWPIHVLGKGKLEAELKLQASTSKTKIVFHGWMDNQSKQYQQLLGQAAIYVMVSSAENASQSILEALSSGCAALVGQGSGSQEMVNNSGICIPPGDAVALRRQLNHLINHPKDRHRLQIKARKRALGYNWSRVTNQYHRLIQSNLPKSL